MIYYFQVIAMESSNERPILLSSDGNFLSAVRRHAVQRMSARLGDNPGAAAGALSHCVGLAEGNQVMRLIMVMLTSALFATSAFAQTTCESQAVSKDGKPLAGAAKTAFLKKCKRDACEPKAVSADGKPLAGAAKNSFLKKCEAGA
jgi:hypothetical protein